MFGILKKGLKSNQAINPVQNAQGNLNEITRLNQERMSRVQGTSNQIDDRTKQMLERMNKLNGR